MERAKTISEMKTKNDFLIKKNNSTKNLSSDMSESVKKSFQDEIEKQNLKIQEKFFLRYSGFDWKTNNTTEKLSFIHFIEKYSKDKPISKFSQLKNREDNPEKKRQYSFVSFDNYIGEIEISKITPKTLTATVLNWSYDKDFGWRIDEEKSYNKRFTIFKDSVKDEFIKLNGVEIHASNLRIPQEYQI